MIGLNAALLHDDTFNDPDPEILKATYPVGDCFIAYEVPLSDHALPETPPQIGYSYRGHVSKASGVQIPTTAFLTTQCAGVSALLGSRTRAWNPNDDAADAMLTIHNHAADNPIADGFFPFGREGRFRESDHGVVWTKHPHNPRRVLITP